MSENTARLELEQLVLDAFAIAARHGKADWYRMRGTVLKNRLLDLTGRGFEESKYGARRFSDLVDSMSEMLDADYSTLPFLIELREPYRSQVASATRTRTSAPMGRIRPDLWHAVVDYSSSAVWAWDRRSSRAVQVDGAHAVHADDILPTANRATFQRWRAEFAEEHAGGLGKVEMSNLTEWATKGLGTAALPLHLRNSWNDKMRQLVLDRLLDFFRRHDDDPPSDLVNERRTPKKTDELRSFVMRCVALMTEQELKELPIPIEVAMRVRR